MSLAKEITVIKMPVRNNHSVHYFATMVWHICLPAPNDELNFTGFEEECEEKSEDNLRRYKLYLLDSFNRRRIDTFYYLVFTRPGIFYF